MIHRSLSAIVLTLTLVVALTFASSGAAEARTVRIVSSSSSSTSKIGVITSADFAFARPYLPGVWKVETGSGTAVFTKGTAKVALSLVPKAECNFQTIRIAALKAWGGERLDQSKVQLQSVILGRSNYRGYKWIQPAGAVKEYHWCQEQDPRKAAHVIATGVDKETLDFLGTNFIRQLTVRSARR